MNFLSACSHVTKIGGIRKKENKSQKLNIYILFKSSYKNGNAGLVIRGNNLSLLLSVKIYGYLP